MTEEMIQKAKACGSVEELIALAKENGLELTEEAAKGYFERINAVNGELADDELDGVSGGCGGSDDDDEYNPYISRTSDGNCSECGKLLGRKRVTKGSTTYEYWYCSNCKKYSANPIRKIY